MKKRVSTPLLHQPGALLFWVCLLTSPGILAKNLALLPGSGSAQPPAPAASGDTVRINCGGGQVVADGGKLFLADTYFTGGKSFGNPAIADILQTNDDELYRTEHSATTSLVPFSYNIPVRAGTYTVRLHLAEIYFGATGGGPGGSGKRIFSVGLEGQPVLVDYDLNASVGAMTAVVKEYQTTVTDGALTLNFTASVDQPSVAAIEVLRGSDTPLPSCGWKQVASVAVERKEGQSAMIDGKLYTFGGYYGSLLVTNLTQRYDLSTDQWATLAPAPYGVTHMGAAVLDKKVWLIGGFAGDNPGPVTNVVQIYDTQTNTWSLGPPLPAPRGSNAAAVVGRKIHAYGGLLPDRRTDAADHYVLDVDNIAAGWQSAAPLPEPRNHLGGASGGGKLYAIGGQNDHDGNRNIRAFLHVYDPTTDTWTRLADLPVNRSHFEPGTIVVDGKILIVGGSQNYSDYGDILRYDPATNSWDKFCDMPATLVAPFAQVLGNTLVVAQGARDNFAVSEKTTQLSPITRTPSNVLRFSSAQQAVQVPQGGSTTLRNLLWTYSGTASYSLTLSNAPTWLRLPASSGAADPLGQEVALQINAAGLAPGTYTAAIQATAPGYTAASTILTLTVTAASNVVFAVNAGGAAYTDATGLLFQSDQAFQGGRPYSTSSPIAGTTDDFLYQTERYGNFRYAVPLPNGTYQVTFKLAEVYWTAPRQRLFDVLAEDQEVISNLDIYAQAGPNTALDLERTVTVTDGELTLQFRTDVDNAKLAALVVRTAPSPAAKEAVSVRKLPKTWSLFPNPAAKKATLSFTTTATQQVRTEVLNSQASLISSNTQQVVAGVNELEIATEKLKPGAYIVRVYLQEGIINERMLVIK